jgi:cell division septum initiation protein DivIVA
VAEEPSNVDTDDIGPGERPAGPTGEALSLLRQAQRVAEEAVREARGEAERLLAAAHQEAQQLRQQARQQVEAQVAEAGREAKALRERAREQSEGLVTAARAELGQLQEAASRLRSEHTAATSTARALAARLLDAAGGPDDDHPTGDTEPHPQG